MPIFMMFVGYLSAMIGYSLTGKTFHSADSFYYMLSFFTIVTSIYFIIKNKKRKA